LEIFIPTFNAHFREMGQGRRDLTGLDYFTESLAVGVLTDEAWVEYMSRITR